MRIIPRNNEEVNEDWISDKARFQYDGLKRQRLNIPLVKDKQGAFSSALWREALTKVWLGHWEAAGTRKSRLRFAIVKDVGGHPLCSVGDFVGVCLRQSRRGVRLCNLFLTSIKNHSISSAL